jgi:osmotically-inducible protein OsmY
MIRRTLLALSVLVWNPIPAQESGSIIGQVIDPQQAVIPNVKISARHLETGIKRETVSTGDGVYSFAGLAVGTYAVTAEAAGFKKTVAPNVKVEVAQRVQLDLALEIGQVAETVDVSAAPVQLQTSDSEISAVVESKAISDLPLNGRNFTQLMVLMAGSTERASGTVAGHYAERAGGTAFSVNGHRQTANQFLIDQFC